MFQIYDGKPNEYEIKAYSGTIDFLIAVMMNHPKANDYPESSSGTLRNRKIQKNDFFIQIK
jgi:hypothetical protein